jgi:hypothetical protein
VYRPREAGVRPRFERASHAPVSQASPARPVIIAGQIFSQNQPIWLFAIQISVKTSAISILQRSGRMTAHANDQTHRETFLFITELKRIGLQ